MGKLSGGAAIFQLCSPVLWLEQGPKALEESELTPSSPGSRTLSSTHKEKLDESRESERWSVGGGWGRVGEDMLQVAEDYGS